MSEGMTSAGTRSGIEDLLRQDLIEGDAMLASVGPIMRHLLVNENHSLFGDEVLARVRGMIHHLATQLCGDAGHEAEDSTINALAHTLLQEPELLAHVHGLAIEWQLTTLLQARLAIDPVLSPLLQALIASRNGGLSGLAMSLLASQARFAQATRRMQLPIGELPADQLETALNVRTATIANAHDFVLPSHDVSRSRIGLADRLLGELGASAVDALTVANAGVALFFSALALTAGLNRDLAIFGATEGQFARLALMLRAAGLKSEAVAEQLSVFYPDIMIPEDFDQVGSDNAAALLVHSSIRGKS
jgi:hypothetical protein